jgi:hypothetical protein
MSEVTRLDLMQSIKISSLCVFGEKLGKGSVNLACIPVIKPNMVYVQRPMTLKPLLYSYDTFPSFSPNTHKLDILILCINIVFILQKKITFIH